MQVQERQLMYYKLLSPQLWELKVSNFLILTSELAVWSKLHMQVSLAFNNINVVNKVLNGYKNLKFHLKLELNCLFVCLFCSFTSQVTAMVMAGRSVHLTTWASLSKQLTSTSCTYFGL